MKHALPYLRPCLGCGSVKPDLVQKPAFERFVEIGGQICRGDHDAFDRFHLLKDDILYGILHLVDGV